MKVTDFINGKVVYDKASQQLHIRHAKNEETYLAQVRGWDGISKLRGSIEDLSKFQDEIGQFIADAINDKIELSSPTYGPDMFGLPIYPAPIPNKDIIDCIKKGSGVIKNIQDKNKAKRRDWSSQAMYEQPDISKIKRPDFREERVNVGSNLEVLPGGFCERKLEASSYVYSKKGEYHSNGKYTFFSKKELMSIWVGNNDCEYNEEEFEKYLKDNYDTYSISGVSKIIENKKTEEINAYPLYDIGFGMSMMKKWMATHNVNKVGDICYDGMAKVTFISNRSLNYEIRVMPIDGNNLGAGFGNTLSIKFNK